MINTRQCEGCVYRSEEGWCMKSYITGKSRTVIDGRTVTFPRNHVCKERVLANKKDELLRFGDGKEKKNIKIITPQRVKTAERGRPLLLDGNPKAMYLYTKGATDAEIAVVLKCSKRTVWLWRKRNELKSNGKFGGVKNERSAENQG